MLSKPKVSEFKFKEGKALTFPRDGDRLRSRGKVKGVAVFVDFPDRPASKTPLQVANIISGLSEFLQTVSYDRMHLELKPHLEWLRLSKPSTSYGVKTYEDHFDYIQEAVRLANSSLDFSGVEWVVVMNDPDRCPFRSGPTLRSFHDDGIVTEQGMIANAVTSGTQLSTGMIWAAHEIGHSLGLPDLYLYSPGPEQSQFDPTGEYSLMGSIWGTAPEYFAFERWYVGWLDDDNVSCHAMPEEEEEEEVTLTAVELPRAAGGDGGKRLALLRLSSASLLAVESRRKVGYDADMSREGAVAYVVDVTLGFGEGVIRVIRQEPLRLHESLKVDDSGGGGGSGVCVTVTKTDANTDTVKFTRE